MEPEVDYSQRGRGNLEHDDRGEQGDEGEGVADEFHEAPPVARSTITSLIESSSAASLYA